MRTFHDSNILSEIKTLYHTIIVLILIRLELNSRSLFRLYLVVHSFAKRSNQFSKSMAVKYNVTFSSDFAQVFKIQFK